MDLQDVKLGDIDLFMARYDKNNDKKLLFSEFTKAFTPLDDYYSSKLNHRSSYGSLSEKTQFLYRNLWSKHFKLEKQAEEIRSGLFRSSTFNAFDAF